MNIREEVALVATWPSTLHDLHYKDKTKSHIEYGYLYKDKHPRVLYVFDIYSNKEKTVNLIVIIADEAQENMQARALAQEKEAA